MQKGKVFLGLLCLAVLAIPSAFQVEVGETSIPPVIDGDLNDTCWMSAARIVLPHLLGSDATPSQRTEVLLLHDSRNLYLAFLCYESNIEGMVTNIKKHDEGVWKDDSVEIFLAPNSQTYYHFLVNPLSITQEEKESDVSWDAPWEAKAKVLDERWQVEISIPFSSIPLVPGVGNAWRANFCRNEKPHGELSSWGKLEKSFHEPQNFGTLLFSPSLSFDKIAEEQMEKGRRTIEEYLQGLLEKAKRSDTNIGKRLVMEINAFLPKLQNSDPRQLDLSRFKILSEKMILAEKFNNASYIVAQENNLKKLRKDKPYSGEPAKEIVLYSAKNERRSTQIVILPLQGDLKGISLNWSDLRKGRERIPKENLDLSIVGYIEIKQPTSGAEAGVYPDPLLPYNPFDVPLETFQPLWLTVYVPEKVGGGWYEGWLDIKPTNAPPTRVKIRLRVFDFVLPTTPSLRTCFLLWDNYLARYHKIAGKWGWFESPPVYSNPDALSLSSDAPQGRYALQAPYTLLRWNNITAPFQGTCDENTYLSFSYKSNEEGTTFALFGTPQGNKFFTPKEQEKGKWHRVVVRIANCGVPIGSSFSLQFVHDWEGGKHSFLIDDIEVYRETKDGKEILFKEDFERWVKDPLYEIARKYRLNMLEHRVSDCNVASPEVMVQDGKVEINWEKFDRELEFYLRRGLNGFNINWLRIPGGWGEVGEAPPEQMAISREIMRQTEEHLRSKGWAKWGYIYAIDEPSSQYFGRIKEIFSFVKEHAPSLKRLLTFGYGATRPWEPGKEGLPAYADLAGYVDIWVPHSDCFHYPFLRERQKVGDEIWMYVCISAQKPYPNIWAIDYPGIDHRILFWQCFKYDVEGFLYWAITYWEKNPWEDPQTYPGGNGDGSLLYPGEDGPINSIRWEIIREGIEDYDYLQLLKGKIGEKAKKELEGIVEDLTKYTQDGEKLEERRIRIGEMLEKLMK